MCRRTTPRARNAVIAAQEEARAAGNAEVGTGHLALGLLSEPLSLAIVVIEEQGVTSDAVREAVTATLPAAADDVPPVIPYDPQAAKALELTYREALRLGHNYIGTEHVLLALLELEAGDGVLSGLGLDKAVIEARLIVLLTSITADRKP